MKNKFLNIAMLFAMAATITSCSQNTVEDEEQQNNQKTANSTLKVRATSNTSTGNDSSQTGSETSEINYPVNIYIFQMKETTDGTASMGKCVALSTLTNDEEEISFNLIEGQYKICAVGGADTETYDLPTQTDATPESAIKLKEGKAYNDLMTATNTITLKDNEESTLTLALKRKVMMIQNITMKNIPSDVTAVSLSITPLKTGIALNGDYTGSDGTQTIDLALSETSGVWKNSGHVYMLATSGDATITVSMTRNGKQKSYTYTSADELQPNYKINITGTFLGDNITVSGTMTGAIWDGTKEITFKNDNFSESADTRTDSTEKDDKKEEAPSAGSVYKGAYVLKSETEGSKTIVTLMSAKNFYDWSFKKGAAYETVVSEVNKKVSELGSNEITGWRLPTEEEITYANKEVKNNGLNSQLAKLDGIEAIFIDTGSKYFFSDDTGLRAYQLDSGYAYPTASIPGNYSPTTFNLRVFATITFE